MLRPHRNRSLLQGNYAFSTQYYNLILNWEQRLDLNQRGTWAGRYEHPEIPDFSHSAVLKIMIINSSIALFPENITYSYTSF